MGCVSSKETSESENAPKRMKKGNPSSDNKNKAKEKKEDTNWEKEKAKLNPEDFMVRKLNGQTIIKEPGSVNGQQFIIEDCVDCDIFVCDYSASITIDNCTNCRFFIGPVDSSIFVRDCKNCKGIIACRQWRTRDCENLDILLYCLTQPIIESSSKLRFGCFQYYYPALLEQFEKANLNIFINCWSNMYDFTPGKTNWEFLSQEEITDSFLKALPPTILPEGESKPSVVPFTWGIRPSPFNKSALVLFIGAHKGKASEFCAAINKTEGGKLVVMQVVEKQIPADVSQSTGCQTQLKAIAIEINGEDDVVEKTKQCAKDFVSLHFNKETDVSSIMFISPSFDNAHELIGKIFEQVQVNIEL